MTKKQTQNQGNANVKVVFNTEKNGIELLFKGKPQESIRESLKENNFKWNRAKQLWWAKNTSETKAFVESLVKQEITCESAKEKTIQTTENNAKKQEKITKIDNVKTNEIESNVKLAIEKLTTLNSVLNSTELKQVIDLLTIQETKQEIKQEKAPKQPKEKAIKKQEKIVELVAITEKSDIAQIKGFEYQVLSDNAIKTINTSDKDCIAFGKRQFDRNVLKQALTLENVKVFLQDGIMYFKSKGSKYFKLASC